jgi:DNA repair protein RadC
VDRWKSDGTSKAWDVREKKYTSDVCDLEDGELLQLLGFHGPSGLIEPRARSRKPECRIDSIQLCLDRLGKADPCDFLSIQGVGRTRASQLAAAVEVGRRSALPRWRTGTRFEDPKQVYQHCARRLATQKRECFLVLMLDSRNRLCGEWTVSIGSLQSSIVHPREVFSEAIRDSASSIIAVHNHPSGDPGHSEEDLAVTRRLHRCGRLLGIELIDHVIVGRGEWRSLRDDRLGPWSP